MPRYRARFCAAAFVCAATLCSLQCAAQGPRNATLVWSVGPLTPGQPQPGTSVIPKRLRLSGPSLALIQTGTAFAATRSVVFAGDRVVLLADLGPPTPQSGSTSADVMALVSLDANTGVVKNTRQFSDLPGAELFATSDAHVIVATTTGLFRLTPDLQTIATFQDKATGYKHNHIRNISPDGTTLGDATSPGYDLLNSATFQPTRLTELDAPDSSVSNKGLLSDKIIWTGYPLHDSYVEYIDAAGEHRLYHGKCGANPVFLTDTLFLEQGCKDALILNLDGKLVRTLNLKLPWSFAGVSQDQRRFALQIKRPGTLLRGRVEMFAIYSVQSGERIAQVKSPQLPLQQSWTAFSPDATLFVVGSALKLNLYRLP